MSTCSQAKHQAASLHESLRVLLAFLEHVVHRLAILYVRAIVVHALLEVVPQIRAGMIIKRLRCLLLLSALIVVISFLVAAMTATHASQCGCRGSVANATAHTQRHTSGNSGTQATTTAEWSTALRGWSWSGLWLRRWRGCLASRLSGSLSLLRLRSRTGLGSRSA